MKLELSTRDLINVGVFTAVYFVVTFLSAFVGVIAPWAQFVGYAIGILLGGPVVVLLFARSPRFGVLTLMGLIVQILMVLTGMFWGLLLLGPVLGLLADLIARAGKYAAHACSAAYAIFSLWYVGALLPIIINGDAFYADIARQMGAEYAAGTRALFSAPVILGFAIVVLALGYVAGLFGSRLLRKHFVRAGLAAA